MQTDLSGGTGLAIVAGDVLALRGTGLAAAETWALLCQAAQALQDLFLSNGGVVGGSRSGPVVTPHTLELTPRGRVLLQLAPPETARAYLPPEYRPGRIYSDTDSEKMWMYSLGRALLDTTPRVAALTGTVSVSPSSALQSVLAAMTEPDPRRRASLMNLLDVISEYCRTRLQSKPFTHIVMDMYREVIKSPQYAARKRTVYQHLNPPAPPRNPTDLSGHNHRQPNYHHHHPHHQPHLQQLDPLQSLHGQPKSLHRHQDRQYYSTNHYSVPRPNQQRSAVQYQPHQHHQQLQDPPQQAPISKVHHYHHHHPAKGALFKLQSRNSHSHPNLTSLGGQQSQPTRRQEPDDRRTQFQSQLNVQTSGRSVGPAIQHQRRHHHSRTYSQPVYTGLQHTRSSGNLPSTIVGESNAAGNVYSDPIYALPVKPFLSSQDVRVNGLSVKPPVGHRNEDVYTGTTIARRPSVAGYSHPDITSSSTERTRDEIYGRSTGRVDPTLQRQHSNPQLPRRDQQEENFIRIPEQDIATTDHRCPTSRETEQIIQQQNPVSSIRVRSLQGPPKPPRIITTLKKPPFSDAESSKSEPPAKPPRNLLKNGPRARRGKAVQRAPSRLYRTVGGPMRSFNKAQCVGPEFVVRANQPPKTLFVGQVKAGNSGRIVVIMLTGQRVEVTCDPQKVTAGDLFQAIVQAESLDENFTLGLAVLLAGDFAILPPDTKLNKVAPPGWLCSGKSKGLLGLPTSFMLYLRLRFFLPSLRGIRSWISKHLLYLQIRRCILEQQLVCPYAELINLTGLALQAEFGNYNVNEHGCGDYFLLEHYVPESLILTIDQHQSQINNGGTEALRARLHQAHRDRRGLDSNKAEEMFITHAQTLPDYGSHYYIATVDSKDLEKVMAQQRRKRPVDNRDASNRLLDSGDNIYGEDGRSQEYQMRGRIEVSRLGSCENVPKILYDARKPGGLIKSATTNDIYGCHKSKYRVEACNNNNVNNMNNNNSMNHSGKSNKGGKKKTESNVWLAIHAQGLKLFERGGEPRERVELAQFQWKDIQTLSYSKSCLVVYSKVNRKRCKFKLRMDHRKSYFAFKLTSLHHQFFLRLRSELTSLQGLAKEFGVPATIEAKVVSPSKSKSHDSKTKIAIAHTVKNSPVRQNFTMQLEEYQNKENEKPEKDVNVVPKTKDSRREPGFYSAEDDALYAQVNVRLEPEGESRDTEDESERSLTSPNDTLPLDGKGMKNDGKLYNCSRAEIETDTECGYSLPKIMSSNDMDQVGKPDNPEELYAAINKVGISRKNEFPVPDEVWDVSDVKKSLHKMKTSSLPNYGTPRQTGGYRTPSLPRRLGVKMGTRAIYSSLVQKDTALTDDMESLSLKSDTESSIQSLSARSTESPLPEAYVLNADIRTNDETFRVTEDESMSASLVARLEELSFAEERILETIKLERGHGGSIGLQVTEGNDGGVYVQAVSVGGSADMAGNVNKGDRIVAINGQNLLHLRYEDALKMLQSSSDTIELVLSQSTSRKNATSRQVHNQAAESNYLSDIRFDVSSEADTLSMTNKWFVQRTTDVASVQNTSSAYSSAASSAMGNHNANSLYMTDFVDNGALKSASMLLSIEDFDVSRTSRAESAGSTPPVPPRRKKRKAKPAAIAKSPEGTSPARSKKPDRKRLAPPPPPPRAARRIKPRVARDQREGRTSNAQAADDEEETLNSLSSIETGGTPRLSPLRFEDADPVQTMETGDEEDDKNDGRSPSDATEQPRERPFIFETFSKREANKYPPLFFTLHDFQNVMSSSLRQEDEPNNLSSVEFANSVRDSFLESFENSVDDEENEICFRVTTTNLPFEKCLDLDRWTTTFADHIIGNLDEPSRFIFEDYMDRSSKMNIRRSAGPMGTEGFEEEAAVPRLTKVRFVIESPSSSTPDYELDENGEATCDSLQNIDPLIDEEEGWNRGCRVQLTEITDDMDLEQTRGTSQDSSELCDVPFSSILKTRSGTAAWSSLENASNFVGTDDGEEPFPEDGNNRADPYDMPRSSVDLDSQDELFRSTLAGDKIKAVDVGKTEMSLIDAEMECRFALAGVDCLDKLPDDNDFTPMTVSYNVEDNKESLDGKKLLQPTCGIEDDNMLGGETVLENVNGFDYIEQKSGSNDVNSNFVEEKSIICDEEGFTVNEGKPTINETKVFDQQVIANEIDNSDKHLVSKESETDIDASVTKIEERQQVKIDPPDKSMQHYRRKVFVSDSLRNMMNRCDFESNDSASNDSEQRDQELDTNADSLGSQDESRSATKRCSIESIGKIYTDKLNNTPSIPDGKQSQDSFKSFESAEMRGSITVPVNVRRNSFLENMLSENSSQVWSSCEIVAAHSKLSETREESISVDIGEKKLPDRSNESVRMDSGVEKILQESKASLKKVDTPLPRSKAPKNVIEANKRSAGEVKCEVLNELLSNFSNIRLKSTNGEKKKAENHVPITSSARWEKDADKIDSKPKDRVAAAEAVDNFKQTADYSSSLMSKIQADRSANYKSLEQSGTLQHNADSSTNHQLKTESLRSQQTSEISSDRKKEHPETNPNKDQATRSEGHSAPPMIVNQVHVEPRQTDTAKNVSDGRPRTGGATEGSVERLQVAGCSEKTDAKDESHNRGGIARQLELSRGTSNGDKSAIDRRIPRPHCNNNDNNRAVTPVAVSDDQSRDTVTITPGRVRSFVKYYEIRREATADKDPESNDRTDSGRVPEHQSVFSIRRGLEARAVETMPFDVQKKDNYRAGMVDKSSERLIVSSRREDKRAAIMEEIAIENLNRTNDRVANFIPDDPTGLERRGEDESPLPVGGSYTQSGKKPKRKKSVKFQGGFTVIGARNPDADGPVGSPAIRDAELSGEKKTPDRQTLKGNVPGEKVDLEAGQPEILLDADWCSFGKRENTAQIQTAAKCEECSGINRFVPKPETPRLVFYCTV